jgi:hypothetical protein
MKAFIVRHIAMGVSAGQGRLALFAILIFSLVVMPFVARSAFAAAAQGTVRFDRMQTSTATTGTICLNPSTSSIDVKTWQVTFPTGYVVSTTAANWQTSNISTTNLAWPSGGTAWPNATAATASVSGQTVTWTNTAAQSMSIGTLYCYNWTATAAVTTPSSPGASIQGGSIVTKNSSAVQIDSAAYTTAVVSSDQISVTATVPAAFSFALSGSSDPLGQLSTASVTTSGTPITATVNTNAKNGWSVWAKDASTGLTSANASKTIASTTPGSNSTLVAGTEGYNTGVTTSQAGGAGTITVQTPFVGGSLGKGGGLNTSLQMLVNSNGTANAAVLTLKNNVAINATTPAATDYTDTITVVGAGLF